MQLSVGLESQPLSKVLKRQLNDESHGESADAGNDLENAQSGTRHQASDEVQEYKKPKRDVPLVSPGLPEYSFTKFCYRHDPEIQKSTTHVECHRQELSRTADIQKRINALPRAQQREVHHIISKYNSAERDMKKLIVDAILSASCFPQLSYISSQVSNMIKINFISILPQELSLKILSYLDCQSLCNATRVCKSWKVLCDDDRVWYHMCEQHIDRKCPNCGWGLPLLHMKRAKFYMRRLNDKTVLKANSSQRANTNDVTGIPNASETTKTNGRSSTTYQIERQLSKSWKDIYRERFKVEANWRKGHCKIKEFKGHMDGVLTLQSNYGVLFTGSYDSTVAIWDLYSGKLIRRLRGHNDGVKTLIFDDKKLITGSLDKTIRIWNYITGECISTYRGHTDSVLSVDAFKKVIVSGSADKTVKVWHVESRTCYTLRGHTEWVNCVKLHPPSCSCYSGSDDGTIRMWDLRTNKCLKVFKGHVGQVQKVIPLKILDVDNLVVDTPPTVGEEEEEEEEDTNGHGNGAQENRANSENNTELHESAEFPAELEETIPYPTHLLSCSLDNTIKLWEVQSGKCVRTQFGHVEGLWDIAADNFRIISGSHDGSIKIWDLQSGKCIHTFMGRRLQGTVEYSGAGTSDASTLNTTATASNAPNPAPERFASTQQSVQHASAPIACVYIGDSECFSGDEHGCVKMYKFDFNQDQDDEIKKCSSMHK